MPENPRARQTFLGATANDTRGDLCIFAHYSRTNHVSPHVFHYLQAIYESNFSIVFVSTADHLSEESLAKLRQICMKIVIRKNIGYDFGSWKCGLLYCDLDLKRYNRLLLTNDSIYAPLYPLREALTTMNADMNGITDSYEIKYHLMSYFILYNKSIFHTDNFLQKWRTVRMLPNILKGLIIELYEIGISQFFLNDGYSLHAYLPVKKLAEKYVPSKQLESINSVHMLWPQLVAYERCPIMKVDLFPRFIKQGQFNDWRSHLKLTDYPIELITQHQKIP